MDDSSMGKLSGSSFQRGREAAATLVVPVSTIDDVIVAGKASPPTLIKIDTEGMEYRILAGGRQTLKQFQPTLVLEYHGCADDAQLLVLLEEHGYQCRIVETGRSAGKMAVEPGQHLLCWIGPEPQAGGPIPVARIA